MAQGKETAHSIIHELRQENSTLRKRLSEVEREVQKLKEKVEPDYYDDDEDDDYWDEDDYREKQLEELAERAANCSCGAWQMLNNGKVVHVADCCCGAE